MKKLSYVFYLVLVAVLASCTNKTWEEEKVNENFKHQVIEVKGGWQYTIIKYEGHKYLCNSHGGLVHVESCMCKNGN